MPLRHQMHRNMFLNCGFLWVLKLMGGGGFLGASPKKIFKNWFSFGTFSCLLDIKCTERTYSKPFGKVHILVFKWDKHFMLKLRGGGPPPRKFSKIGSHLVIIAWFQKNGCISLNNCPIWKIQKLAYSGQQAPPYNTRVADHRRLSSRPKWSAVGTVGAPCSIQHNKRTFEQ